MTEEEKNNDIDGFIDEVKLLSNHKHQELLKSIRSIKLALVKVK